MSPIQSITNPRLSLNILTPEEVRRIHTATLEVLETVGVRFPSPKALDILAAHGCSVDRESMVARKPGHIVEEYLAFQRLRFGERLRWTVEAAPELQDVRIPRFTIQPFVENAVRHGIEPQEEGGSVEISARIRKGRLLLDIRDTGVGMAAAGRGSSGGRSPGRAGEGIGISNVRKRLELRYGPAARLTVRSERGQGTAVRIGIPAERAGGAPS